MTTEHPTGTPPTSAPARQYPPVPAQIDLPAMEREIIAFWRADDTFAASLAGRRGRPRWTFYEGPPTANGRPGAHHLEARVFKDLFPRFKTMRGYLVDRKAGWDCQGLHVEVGVEKELGISGKQEIERYGIAEFNQRCRESVERATGDFEVMTERMGYWVDTAHAYRTMDRSYIESVWWSLKRIFEAGLLVESQRVSPYCPRCETTLSDHELGQPGGYETVVDPSVFVRFPLTSGPLAERAAMLVWTTTPWTLVSNTAVAVHPDVDYVVAERADERLILAEPLSADVLGEEWSVVQKLRGADMAGWRYRRPLDLVDFPADSPAHFVVLADYVTTEDGTGLVHQSPAFGPEDMAVARANGLPVVQPVRADGRFSADVPVVGGQFFKHADGDLVRELDRRGVLFRHESYEHAYPHCWRCHTPLMYYALPAWYIRTTEIKDALLRENEATAWYPETTKWGRYGDWLRNNVDWSLSRTRYWGTPLPIWRCAEGHLTCVGSVAELEELGAGDLGDLDPHRPFVDDLEFPCPEPGMGDGPLCGRPARRTPEVIDAWYDSGSMPFAQWGYPHLDGSREAFDQSYPAQFICEGLDQTRGWFYSLMAVGTLVFDRSAYENVVCLGLLLAEDGRKMSKHLGNILEPLPLMERHGADAVRWFMAAAGSPWAARRVADATIQEIVRKVLLTYWNTVAFQALYARANDWAPGDPSVVASRPVLDRWLVSERSRLVAEVTAALDAFDTQRAGQLLADFVDDLSNWYVRRSRRRFWLGDHDALTTLHETVDVVTRLMAPFTPFVTERVWQALVRSVDAEAPASVHLADWPSYDKSLVDEGLVDDGLADAVALTRRLVELGRAARAGGKLKTRQPLRRLLVSGAAFDRLGPELREQLAAELNVESVEPFGAAGDLVDFMVKPNFRNLGKRFGKQTPRVAAAVVDADAARLAADLGGADTTEVVVDGEVLMLTAEDVVVSERPREGWSVVNEHGETVALDLQLTPELVSAGLARDVIRCVQEARKSAGLDVSDRILVSWHAGTETATAIRAHAESIAAEVLALELTEAPGAGPTWDRNEELGLAFRLERA